jgi:glutamyl-tRNA synthetase
MSIRVRFAPSPTGYLHVGGARTALFNWLYARHTGGKFLLRIEDTDKQRSTDEHTQVIIDGLDWLGLDWDEEVVFQGARIVRHQEAADRLLAEGKAYLDEGAIRFRMPTGEIAWDDAVHDRIAFQGEDLKDFVILRTDRTPIYNLAVVVDDVDMDISHVLRGDDHISNTPKQIALYRALGHEPPVFGHVPMINGMDGKKLSKRHGATAVGDYQHLGILPAAMRNFLALLGWSPGGDREIMTRDEMVQLFSFDGVQKKAAVFDTTKLEWMNGQYLSASTPEDLFPLIAPQLSELGVDGGRDAVLRAIGAVKTRSRTTIDVARQVAVRLDGKFVTPDEKAVKEVTKDPAGYRSALQTAVAALRDVEWTPQAIEAALRALADKLGVPAGKVFQPIRIALTGGTVSEPVNELLFVIGKAAALERLATTRP